MSVNLRCLPPTSALRYLRAVKLDPAASDQVLAALRPLLPAGVEATRMRERTLRLSFKSPKEQHYSAQAVFGRIPRRAKPVQAIALAARRAAQQADAFFKTHDLRWPGHDWGPTTIKSRIEGGLAYVMITDLAGHVVEIGPMEPASPS